MPGYNGTGPLGAGPMTGRGGGYCMSYYDPDRGFDRRFWFCRGGGWGRQNRYFAAGRGFAPGVFPIAPVYSSPLNNVQDLDFLKDQAKQLENTLEQIKNRIKELENKD